MSAKVGSLHVDATMESAAFHKGAAQLETRMKAMQKRFAAAGAALTSAGQKLSIGLSLPFAALMAKAIPAAKESREALGQVEAALKSMGPAAGRTAAQLQDQAKALQQLSTFDDDDILRSVTANMLTFGNVAEEQFDRAQRAAVDLASRMGTDLQSAALMIGKALNDPVKGLAALRRVGIQFDAQQQQQIKTMAKVGNVAGAQAVMLGELERQFGGSAAAMRAADPGAALTNSWNDFLETVGEIALKVLPPLTAILQQVVDKFNSLSPSTQKAVVVAAALAAALGPVLMVLGPLASGIGALLPLLGGLGGFLLPIAAAAAAVYLAWKNWDTIGPMLAKVGAAIQTALGPAVMDALAAIRDALLSLWNGPVGNGLKLLASQSLALSKALLQAFGPVVLAALRVVITALGSFVEIVAHGLNAVAALLQGDFSGAWQHVKGMVTAAVAGMGKVIEALVPGALAAIGRLVTGVRDWIGNTLTGIWDGAVKRIRAVGDAFKWLYDVVVGHSYVPDMVDGIAAQMGRLDAAMTAPAQKATAKTAQAFRAMAAEVRGLLDQLFPEAAAWREFQKGLATIDRAQASGALTPDQAEESRRRLRTNDIEGEPFKSAPQPDWLSQSGGAGTFGDVFGTGDNLARSQEELAAYLERSSAQFNAAFDAMDARTRALADNIADRFTDSFMSIVDGTKSAGEAFKDMAADILRELTAIIIKQVLVKLLMMALGGGPLPGFDQGGSIDFGKLPGFATGGRMKVGGLGGVDRNLLSLNGSPIARVSRGEMLNITPGGGGSGGIVINQTFAPNFAGNAVDRQELALFARIVKADTIGTIRDMQRRRR